MIDQERVFRRYEELQAYVDWTEEDAARVRSLGPLLSPCLGDLVEDFYAEIARHPDAHKVFTGGQAQIDRLKHALLKWLGDLLSGPYDRDYVLRRWRVGARHAEIGLDQVYTNVALSRLRSGLLRALGASWRGDPEGLLAAIVSLSKLLDLDLAKIEDAYQAEYVARFQRTERLATLGQIAGGVAHELRNPLNVVKTSIYYMNHARNLTPEKKAEHTRRIERNLELADEVITTLSNFARIPVPAMHPFDLEPCIREVLQDIAMPPGVEVVVDCPPGLPRCLADRSQVHIVLSNLVRNARDAMPEGGRLAVEARRAGDGLELAVADTGVGIAPGDLGRIMEPLFSTKARGLGLGLALVRMIVEKHGGGLAVESEPGRGSTFRVRLHAADDADAGPAA